VRAVLTSASVALGLLLGGEVSVAFLPVHVSIEVRGRDGEVALDGSQHAVIVPEREVDAHIRFEQPGPLQREYQIDGSDTTTRNDLGPAQFVSAQDAAWYHVMAWLRDEDSYSRWEDARLVDLADGRVVAYGRGAAEASPLPTAFRLEAALRRPESPATIWMESFNSSSRAGFRIDRDQHRASWLTGPDADEATAWFFPEDPWPFAAESLHLVGRTAAAGFGLFAIMGGLGLVVQGVRRRLRGHLASPPALPPAAAITAMVFGLWLTAAVWITVRVYHQLPHIVDAEAYYFQARILETGRTWLQAPDGVRLLDGLQQVIWNDRWFSQYPPGAPAVYAAGGLVGLAWLMGPLAGLVLVGATALAGWRFFGRSVALTALVLGALSPFVLFQAGSFMSHPVAGAALACSLAAFAYAWCTGRQRWYVVVGVFLGVAFNTREIAAVLYGLAYAAWLLAYRRWRALTWIAASGAPLLVLYLAYNMSITGDALLLPRNLSNPSDIWGFGQLSSSVRHTLAAGLVNTDENLTLLQFDLFGWPPLAALALIGLPFLLGQATRLDALLAFCAGAFVVTYVGYFYSGIALGPRYYFEAVPALVLLATRGLQASAKTLRALGLRPIGARLGPCLVVALLSTYTVGYYLPHAVVRRMDYGALDNGRRLVLPFVETTLSGPHLTAVEPPALVLVPNADVFKSLSALNCPLLDRDHIRDCPVLLVRAGVDQWPALLEQFPARTVWVVNAHGDLVSIERVHSPPASR